jgi:hypothetical protein
MIHQLEPPWGQRMAVVLDVASRPNLAMPFLAGGTTVDLLDVGSSASASILTSSHRAGTAIRLVTSAARTPDSRGSGGHPQPGGARPPSPSARR